MQKCVCGIPKSEGRTLYQISPTITIVQCACGMVYTFPPPYEKESLSEEYDREIAQRPHLFLNYARLNLAMAEEQKRPQDTLQNSASRKTLLDIGCGSGATLVIAKECGFNPKGVEINQYQRSLLTKQGFEVRSSLDEFSSGFDVIVLSAVLEHIPDPIRFLKKIRSFMHKNSILLLNVPNYDSGMRRALGIRWVGFQPSQHLWHFTPKTLSKVLQSAGFHVDALELHAQGKGISKSGNFTYDSAGFLIDARSSKALKILNTILDRLDRYLLFSILGRSLRRLSEHYGADNLFVRAKVVSP